MSRLLGVVLSAVVGVVLGATAAVGQQFQPSPHVKLERPREWTLKVTVNLRAWEERDRRGMPVVDHFDFTEAAVVFPFLEGSGSHRVNLQELEGGAPKGRVTFDDRVAATRPEIKAGYPCGARLAIWHLTERRGREIELQVEYPVVSYRVVFDEAAAMRTPWPKEAWPSVVQSCFEPQMYVDFGPDPSKGGDLSPYDMEPVQQLVDKWTVKGKTRTQPPVVTAKWLAGKVVEHVQISGNGLNYNRIGQLEGIDLQGAPETARRGRGTEFDMVCLLAAVYRRADIPARIVIGFEGATEDDRDFLGSRGRKQLRAWVEFALYDETAQTLSWVPVDVVAMRKKRSRLPQNFMEQPLEYFGTNRDLERIIPFSFHFHPPTTVRAYGSPAFWGWFVLPEANARALQAVRFESQRTPQRGAPPAGQERRRY